MLFSEAKRRARRLDQLSDLIFALMECADVLGEGLDERIITALARSEIAAADATRARAPARSRLEAELALQRAAAYLEAPRDAYGLVLPAGTQLPQQRLAEIKCFRFMQTH